MRDQSKLTYPQYLLCEVTPATSPAAISESRNRRMAPKLASILRPRQILEFPLPPQTPDRRRHRASFVQWRAAHWPLFDAVIRGDRAAYELAAAHYAALDEFWDDQEVNCIACRARMIHQARGFFACPYERAGMHRKTRTMALGADAHG